LGGSATAIVNAYSLTVEQDSPAVAQAGGYAYVSFSSGNSLSVGSGNTNNGALTVSGSASATISGVTGSGLTTINPGVALEVQTTFAQTNLTNYGMVTFDNSASISNNLTGTGTTTLSPSATLTVANDFAQGTLNIGSSAVATLNGTAATNTLGVLSGASGGLALGPSVNLQLLQSVGGPPSITHSICSLTMGAGSSLDITNNTLLLNESGDSLAQVTTWVQSQTITSSLVNGPIREPAGPLVMATMAPTR
jgi:hypothetical protein